MTIEHLAFVLMALQAVDAITTYLAIGKGAVVGIYASMAYKSVEVTA